VRAGALQPRSGPCVCGCVWGPVCVFLLHAPPSSLPLHRRRRLRWLRTCSWATSPRWGAAHWVGDCVCSAVTRLYLPSSHPPQYACVWCVAHKCGAPPEGPCPCLNRARTPRPDHPAGVRRHPGRGGPRVHQRRAGAPALALRRAARLGQRLQQQVSPPPCSERQLHLHLLALGWSIPLEGVFVNLGIGSGFQNAAQDD
jgi:hypothetical protein